MWIDVELFTSLPQLSKFEMVGWPFRTKRELRRFCAIVSNSSLKALYFDDCDASGGFDQASEPLGDGPESPVQKMPIEGLEIISWNAMCMFESSFIHVLIAGAQTGPMQASSAIPV
jgi:hypothetical protein